MTIAEIKAKLPEADIYVLTPDAAHIIVLNRNEMPRREIEFLSDMLVKSGLMKVVIMAVDDPSAAVRVLEIVDSTPSTPA